MPLIEALTSFPFSWKRQHVVIITFWKRTLFKYSFYDIGLGNTDEHLSKMTYGQSWLRLSIVLTPGDAASYCYLTLVSQGL